MGLRQKLRDEIVEIINNFRRFMDDIKKESVLEYLAYCCFFVGILIIIGCFLFAFLPLILAILTNPLVPSSNIPGPNSSIFMISIIGMIVAVGPLFVIMFIKRPFDDYSTSKKISSSTAERDKIFIVHGHDKGLKDEVAVFLSMIKIDPIILEYQPNVGTEWLYEKFRESANVKFAIILFTPDDIGKEKGESSYSPRVRQNVILELGIFLEKLGPERVWILSKGFQEKPSDIIGGTYVKYDENGGWKFPLIQSLKAANVRFKV